MKIQDLSIGDLQESPYDLVIWCDGYEERSTFLPSTFSKELARCHAVLCFADDSTPHERSSSYFEEDWPSNHLGHTSGSIKRLVKELEELLPKKKKLRVLIDYSCMPRDWYAGILTILPEKCESISFDFSYSIANHVDPIKPSNVKDYYAVYGCESISTASDLTIAVLGLGFEGIAPLKILDKLEPDITEMFIADPGVFEDYADRAINSNSDVILHYLEDDKDKILRLPLRSMEMAMRGIYELMSPYLVGDNLVMIPMGPKPFVLASIIMAMSYKNVSCMNIKKSDATRSSAPANGELIIARVTKIIDK